MIIVSLTTFMIVSATADTSSGQMERPTKFQDQAAVNLESHQADVRPALSDPTMGLRSSINA